MSQKNSYDDVAYRSNVTRECDPLRMSTIAGLYGLEVADPATCDVLELGCGDGVNLLSLATAYPQIRAVGYDPAQKAIERGDAWRAGAALDNLKLLWQIEDGQLDGGFDYVMAHGVLTWVPDEVRDDVVALAAAATRPGGLVTFSFRAFPYAHYQLVVREMGLDAIAIAEERAAASGTTLTHHDHKRLTVERARLAAATAGPRTPHGAQMASEVEKLEEMEAWTVFHDDLSDPMRPFRVTDVAEMFARHGLRYVGELMPADLWQARLTPELADVIREQAGPDKLRRQQLVDDLTAGGFHNSLFVKAEGEDAGALEPSVAGRSFFVRRHPPGDADADVRSEAVDPGVAQFLRDHPYEATPLTDLASALGRDEADVSAAVLRLYAEGLARISGTPPPVPAAPGAFPTASPLVREQLRSGMAMVTTRFHLPLIYESPIHRALIGLLDGTRDRAAIRRDLPAAAKTAGVTVGLIEVLGALDDVLEAAAIDGLLLPPTGA